MSEAWGVISIKANPELVAKFDYDEVSEIIAPPNALLELTGYTVDGEAFSGGSTVTVR